MATETGAVANAGFLQAVGMAEGNCTAGRHDWLDDASGENGVAVAGARHEARQG